MRRPLAATIITALLMFSTSCYQRAQAATASQRVTLQNSHLVVTFDGSAEGPRLSSAKHLSAGYTYSISDDQQVMLALVEPQSIHDPNLVVTYDLQAQFGFKDVSVNNEKTNAVFSFESPALRVQVIYTLSKDDPVLQKTINCQARKDIYIAGVGQWNLKPGVPMAWPGDNQFGLPAVLLAPGKGCFFTLEWPRAHLSYRNGRIEMTYRPGFMLKAGEAREVSTGSLVCFEKTAADANDLDAARQAFIDHVRKRVNPDVPFVIKFTTWGPWLGHANSSRILMNLEDMAYVGTDLVHFDLGWQNGDHTYSERLAKVRDANDLAWDAAMTVESRLPNGLLPIKSVTESLGMNLSLWFDTTGRWIVDEGDLWAIENSSEEATARQMNKPKSTASEYGDLLHEFAAQCIRRYNLRGILFDDQAYMPDYSTDPNRRSLANAWNSIDIQMRKTIDIFDMANEMSPGLYRFWCRGDVMPWILTHATHLHAGDPGASATMGEVMQTDFPARALAFERYRSWQQRYERFMPPWGVKGDIAGWAIQQGSPIWVNPAHKDFIISSGEGWTFNMFTCFATTAVRDIRFCFDQMARFDIDLLKEWLAWDRERSKYVFNLRLVYPLDDKPNEGLMGYSHVAKGEGVIYLLNKGFKTAQAEFTLNEKIGFRSENTNVSAYMVYPVKAPLGDGTISYGETVKVPVIGKDCVVIETGLERPDELVRYSEYERMADSVVRSFEPVVLTPIDDIAAALRASRGAVRVETGQNWRDRELALRVMDTLGARAGMRFDLNKCTERSASDADCRIIIGTYDGLKSHPDVGRNFTQELYSRYINWRDKKRYSAGLIARLDGQDKPTFCLIAPRPDQLAKLAEHLTRTVLADKAEGAQSSDPSKLVNDYSFKAVIPAGLPVLRFRPVIQAPQMSVEDSAAAPIVRFSITAEEEDKRTLLWQDGVAPYHDWGAKSALWLQSPTRLISLSDLASKEVTLHFQAYSAEASKLSIRSGFLETAILDEEKSRGSD
jgi:hypothetical protein